MSEQHSSGAQRSEPSKYETGETTIALHVLNVTPVLKQFEISDPNKVCDLNWNQL